VFLEVGWSDSSAMIPIGSRMFAAVTFAGISRSMTIIAGTTPNIATSMSPPPNAWTIAGPSVNS